MDSNYVYVKQTSGEWASISVASDTSRQTVRKNGTFAMSIDKPATGVANPELKLPDFQRQRSDHATCEFIAYLKGEPHLKGILSGHLHMFTEDRFSPTAIQHVASGNFSFAAHVVRVI